MGMKDKLISLDALRKEVEQNFDMQNLYLPVHILDVAEDAEEGIVRCKDCKHYRATPGYCAYDRIWQENKGHVWGMYCKPDWFCADGEKRK